MLRQTTFIKRTREADSPLQRMAPGYENYEALSVLFSAAFNRALEELDGYREGDDLQPLLVCLAEHCFRAGIPEELFGRQTALLTESLGGTVDTFHSFANQ